MYYTKEITGYKWQNLNAANSANASAKTALGIPKTPDSTTQEALEPLPSYKEDGTIDFYYFEGELPPLGNVQTFTIRIEEV